MKLGRKIAELHDPAIGDHVAGFTHGGTYKDRRAFPVREGDCNKVPGDTLSQEQLEAQ